MYQKLSPAAFRKNGSITPYLDGLLTGAVVDLDATMLASYNGSGYNGSGQTWANMIAAPADGSAKTAGDFLPRGERNGHGDGSNLYRISWKPECLLAA